MSIPNSPPYPSLHNLSTFQNAPLTPRRSIAQLCCHEIIFMEIFSFKEIKDKLILTFHKSPSLLSQKSNVKELEIPKA
ncbi:hypothetical protein Scep_030007 [Stephania cephalantha]|uniref:Uncharacterized protein n=1 Tax=Stephania cephalantha TaxID=152367 RepID=A0AAP0HGH4_9MAGN